MSKARRVGGSGWAGVHGSFVGLSKNSGRGKPAFRKKTKSNRDRGAAKIDLSLMPDNEDVQRAAKRVLAVQKDINVAEKRLATLNNQLRVTMDRLQIALNLARSAEKSVSHKKARAKRSKK